MAETTDTDVLEDDQDLGSENDTSSAESSPPEPEPSPPSGEEFLSIRDAAKQFGWNDADSFEDDEQALKTLIEKATAEPPSVDDQLSQYGRRYVEHAAEFEDFLRQKEQEAQRSQQPQDQEPKFWDAPEFNPTWMNQVEVDPETGQLRPTNGGTPETVQRVQKYLQYRQDQQERFWSDPYSYFEPYIEHREQQLESRMRDLINDALGQERTMLQARQFVNENTDWLYEKDAEGNIRFQGGQPVMSEEGQRFAGYVNQLEALPPDLQQDYAMKLLEADRIRSGKKSPESDREENNRKILMNNAGKKKPGTKQTTPPSGDEEESQDLEAMMRDALKGAGYDDEKLREELVGAL